MQGQLSRAAIVREHHKILSDDIQRRCGLRTKVPRLTLIRNVAKDVAPALDRPLGRVRTLNNEKHH
jgi:hypothetical protein